MTADRGEARFVSQGLAGSQIGDIKSPETMVPAHTITEVGGVSDGTHTVVATARLPRVGGERVAQVDSSELQVPPDPED